MRKNRKQGNGWLRLPFWLTYVFLYVPIAVVVLMSFNRNKSPYAWGGFSLRWYGQLLENEKIREGLINTLIVAFGSTVLSTVLGTLLAVGLARYNKSRMLDALSTMPALLPDLVLAIGLLIFYAAVKMTLGLHSVLIAHTVFGMAFVTAVVRARLNHADTSMEEASRDLGATPVTTFMRITLPTLAPGILAGALLAFTLSIDEFVIAFFTAAPTQPTLPIVIYSMVRFGVTPEINALATLLLAVSFTVVIAAQRMTKLTEALS
ncbi:ABC transporter permease [Microtetraspora malaysiensis]|uniref:ABC transporter permease n=1 Tax=Microtetraspora malaysiensis TaxID=161358 RepID=A0ABW6T5W9_9ACTN|nr:ABC transporter permease [Microtetraspora malaysiensis]